MEQTIQEKEFNQQRALWPFLKRLFGLAKESYPNYFYGLIVSVVIVAAADAYFPIIWKHFIDDVLLPVEALQSSNVDLINVTNFRPIAIQFIIWTATISIGVLAFIWCAEQIKERLIYDLRNKMFDKLQYLSFGFYDKNSTGWLVSRITSDTDRVMELISWGFVSVVWGIAMVIVSFTFMFTISWKLGLLIFLTMPLLLFTAIKIRAYILSYSRKARKKNSEMIAYVTEHINGVTINKATCQEDAAIAGYGEQTKKMKRYAYGSAFYTAMYIPMVSLTGSIAAIFVVLMGGNFFIAGSMTLGAWATFFQYSRFIFEPIFDISRFYAMAQDSLSAGERIFSLIDEKREINDQKSKGNFGKITGAIQFNNIDFYYHPDKPILQSFNLAIKAGESIALVGPTGHGKTTITSLVSRFYEPTGGQLLIDGVDYQTKSINSYRKQLGVILQHSFLFSGTIRDNILFGLRGSQNLPSDDKIKTILSQIGAYDLMEKLDLEVGEEGKNLSNGEKQLVSFARAIIKDPAILILDEATSSVDTLTEAKIQQSVQQIIQNRTSIIIAHRLSTIKTCDRIIVIEHGKIKEMGSHQELIKAKGHYYDLYVKQARREKVSA